MAKNKKLPAQTNFGDEVVNSLKDFVARVDRKKKQKRTNEKNGKKEPVADDPNFPWWLAGPEQWSKKKRFPGLRMPPHIAGTRVSHRVRQNKKGET